MGVRSTMLEHISDSKQSKIRRDRTKDVRRSAPNAVKPLIYMDSMAGTANALRPRLKSLPEAEDL